MIRGGCVVLVAVVRSLLESDPTILDDIERLVDEDSRGDPESLLRWTAKSVRQIAGGLARDGPRGALHLGRGVHAAAGLLATGNVKTLEGAQHPDRDAQFRHINDRLR